MPPRSVLLTGCLCLGLSLLCSVGTGDAAAPAGVQRWLSTVLAKIEATDRSHAPSRDRGRFFTVEVRVRVAQDGSVLAVDVESSSGTPSVDERAIAAVKAAGPFAPPPPEMLMANGTTELSFPLKLPGRR